MNIVWAALIVVAVTAVAVAAMLVVRRRAPGGRLLRRQRPGRRASSACSPPGSRCCSGFLIFLGFESYDASRSGAETEALTVAQQIQTAQRLPADVGGELTGQLVCYARFVIHGEWDRMEDGTLGEDINPWGVGDVRRRCRASSSARPSRRPPTASGWTRPRPGRRPARTASTAPPG